MGLIFYSRRDEGASHLSTRSDLQLDQSMGKGAAYEAVDPWMIVVIVVGILIIVTLALFMCAYYIKSRRQRQTGLQPAKKMSAPYSRRRKLGLIGAEQQTVGDLERDMLIRKSLASRHSLATSEHISQDSSPSSNEYRLADPLEGHGGDMATFAEIPKSWEASVQSDGMSANPGGLGLEQHPAFAHYLSVPEPTRMSSPVRGGPAVYRHI
ncbi:hypothetical protein F5X98DRAFT_349065 [Xylaria grammica]|nr:hypothetical protein F5X98DRAFT_349065 [Xylaria grammica]